MTISPDHGGYITAKAHQPPPCQVPTPPHQLGWGWVGLRVGPGGSKSRPKVEFVNPVQSNVENPSPQMSVIPSGNSNTLIQVKSQDAKLTKRSSPVKVNNQYAPHCLGGIYIVRGTNFRPGQKITARGATLSPGRKFCAPLPNYALKKYRVPITSWLCPGLKRPAPYATAMTTVHSADHSNFPLL